MKERTTIQWFCRNVWNLCVV